MWEDRIEAAAGDSRDRDNFGRDRSRVIHSAFFRRLQGKTQVLGLGESDFYRTRLTHSLEVAQIAGGIAEFFSHRADLAEFHAALPSQNLIETIGLAHDIGHPPFGHGGEIALNYAMRDAGGFEGNAQTLRICTRLGEHSDTHGLNLTRRTLLGLVKYPVTHAEAVNLAAYEPAKAPLNIDSYKPPKCIYDDDRHTVEWIVAPLPEAQQRLFRTLKPAADGKPRHRKTLYKSFDSTIMELADDIAYGVHDLEDALAMNLVAERHWRQDVEAPIVSAGLPLADRIGGITTQLFSGTNRVRKKAISMLVNYFIRHCTIVRRGCFDEPQFDLKACMADGPDRELEILKDFIVNYVIVTPELQTLEYKGQQMLVRLFEAIMHNPSRLLPKKYYDEYLAQDGNLRIVCDYLAGTTDEYATRLYHKLFTPSNGSIFERL
ncbi:MAG TPA: anti-phage deoxyguanosine triphosphatase [Burkholderiaceae bacterium]